MFGATAVRRKREKERRERAARNSANTIYPFIKPFGKHLTFLFMIFYYFQHQMLAGVYVEPSQLINSDWYWINCCKHKQSAFNV